MTEADAGRALAVVRSMAATQGQDGAPWRALLREVQAKDERIELLVKENDMLRRLLREETQHKRGAA